MLSSLRDSKVELSLFLILLIFGLPMIVLIPPGAGYDEEDHLIRVWEISALSLIPGQMPPQELKYPIVFRDFAYRQQGSAGVIDAGFWQSYLRAPVSERGFVRRELDTKSVYSPVLLFPQAVAMRLFGRNIGVPTLPAFSLSRLAGLLSYLVLIWLALRLMPFGKWTLLVLAVSPMALFQAATLTPDTISNGIGFLFIAGCLWLAKAPQIGWREAGALVVLIFLLFLAKLNIVPLILLPFLLILPPKFESKRLYALLLAITVALFLIEVAGWNWVASRNFDSLLLDEANPRAQILYMLTDPFAFLLTLLKDAAAHGWTYLQGWINGYGYYYWIPPQIVSLFYLLSLLAVLALDSTSEFINRKTRVIFLLVFAAGYTATIASLYVSYTPVGAEQVSGVQGRYFVPLVLPLFLALASLPWRWKVSVSSPRWVVMFLVSALSLNLVGVFLSFHIPCGSTFYQTSLCYLPLFKDLPNDVRASQPITEGVLLKQEIRVACNGLGEVRLLTPPSTTGYQGMTRFLLEDASNGRTLLDTSVANDQVRAESWYPLRFPPDRESAGNQYVLTILGTTEQGLQLLYTPQSEFNLGASYENKRSLEEDIVLQYGCVTGLRKLFLNGKP